MSGIVFVFIFYRETSVCHPPVCNRKRNDFAFTIIGISQVDCAKGRYLLYGVIQKRIGTLPRHDVPRKLRCNNVAIFSIAVSCLMPFSDHSVRKIMNNAKLVWYVNG
nr:MAG TPA: hypothetical protein [Caudoviricetes sp.]